MGKGSKYVIIFMLYLFVSTVYASWGFSSGPRYPSSSRSKKYSSGSSYYDDDYYGKSKYQPLMTDGNVADIKPESMFDHIVYAFNRFASGYIYPYVQLVWEYTFAPVFNIIMQSINHTLYWIYTNTIQPIFLKLQENMNYITQWIIDIFKRIYTECIGPIMKWMVDIMYDYIYLPACNFFKMIWNNVIKLFEYIGKGIKWLCVKLRDGAIYAANFFRDVIIKYVEKMYQQMLNGMKWIVNKMYDHILTPLKDLFVKLWNDYIYDMLLATADCIKQCVTNIYDSITKLWNDYIYDMMVAAGNAATKYGQVIYDKIWSILTLCRDYIYKAFVASYDFAEKCGKAIYDSIIKLWKDYIYDMIVAIGDAAKKGYAAVYDLISKLWQDYIYDAMISIGDFIKKCSKVVYDYIEWAWIKISDGVLYTMNKLCDAIDEYIIKPLARLLSQIWTDYLCNAMKAVGDFLQKYGKIACDKLYDMLQWMNDKIIIPMTEWMLGIIKQAFKGIWKMIRCIYQYVVWMIKFTKRYLLEINVGKLNIDKTNENLNNFEIGVYYGKVKGSKVYLKKETTGDDPNIYLWLRNNNTLKQANAKIVISDHNDTKIHKKIVRLNKEKSHSIPLNKTIFVDKDENYKRIRVEFLLEDISKTKQDQDNRESIIVNNQNRNMANKHLNNAETDDEDDEDDEFDNVAIGGNGATYIAVDRKTKCYHEFSIHYK